MFCTKQKKKKIVVVDASFYASEDVASLLQISDVVNVDGFSCIPLGETHTHTHVNALHVGTKDWTTQNISLFF